MTIAYFQNTFPSPMATFSQGKGLRPGPGSFVARVSRLGEVLGSARKGPARRARGGARGGGPGGDFNKGPVLVSRRTCSGTGPIVGATDLLEAGERAGSACAIGVEGLRHRPPTVEGRPRP